MPCTGFEEVQTRVLAIVSRILQGRAVSANQDLRNDLGLESVDLMSIALRLETEFDVEVTDFADGIVQLRTVADVARFFDQVLRERT